MARSFLPADYTLTLPDLPNIPNSLCPVSGVHSTSYYCYRCMFGLEYPSCGIRCARFLAEVVEKEGPDNIAAFIAEPEIGAGGMIAPPPEYWPIIRETCDKYDVLLIDDEVMAGFGRTGKMFAIEHWHVKPDIMAMAKGITSAYIPFGAIAFSDEIWHTLKGSNFTTYSYAGHPVGAAAAVKTMEIYKRDKVVENVARVGKYATERLKEVLGSLPWVGYISGLGLRPHRRYSEEGKKVLLATVERAQVRISLATFVPKPHTPFQWVAQENEQQLNYKHELLRSGLRRKGIKLSWQEPKVSLLEAVLSRGDRRLGKVIYRAWQLGSIFDSWGEHLNYQNWLSAFEEAGLEPGFYAQRERSLDEPLPWAHIDVGVTPAFLKREYQLAMEGKETPDCRSKACNVCGLQGWQPTCQQKYHRLSQD